MVNIHITIVNQFLFILQLPKSGNHYVITWRHHNEGANHDLP